MRYRKKRAFTGQSIIKKSWKKEREKGRKLFFLILQVYVCKYSSTFYTLLPLFFFLSLLFLLFFQREFFFSSFIIEQMKEL